MAQRAGGRRHGDVTALDDLRMAARATQLLATPQLREMLDPSSLSMPDGVPVNDATRISVVSNALRASSHMW